MTSFKKTLDDVLNMGIWDTTKKIGLTALAVGTLGLAGGVNKADAAVQLAPQEQAYVRESFSMDEIGYWVDRISLGAEGYNRELSEAIEGGIFEENPKILETAREMNPTNYGKSLRWDGTPRSLKNIQRENYFCAFLASLNYSLEDIKAYKKYWRNPATMPESLKSEVERRDKALETFVNAQVDDKFGLIYEILVDSGWKSNEASLRILQRLALTYKPETSNSRAIVALTTKVAGKNPSATELHTEDENGNDFMVTTTQWNYGPISVARKE